MYPIIQRFRNFIAEQEKRNIDTALEVIKNEGYDFVQKGNQIKILDDDREVAREKLTTLLTPLGFSLNMIPSAGSMGRLEIRDRVNGSVYIFFKPKSRRAAAAAGSDFEDKLAGFLNDLGLPTTTAGSGHGSDLTIVGPTKTITIEAKTALGADFGQFRAQYNIPATTWEPRRTKKFIENEKIFTFLFDGLLRDYLNTNCLLPLDDKRLNIDKNQKVNGLKGSDTTGELKRELQLEWFDGKTDYKVPFDFSRIAHYYADKGDQYIQIGTTKGLYALNPQAATDLGVPLFADSGLNAYIRLRFKPSMGENSSTSFTVAIKIKGRLQPSPINLANPTDVEKIKVLLS